MSQFFVTIFLFCVGVAIVWVSINWIKKQWQFKVRAAVVIGKWAGFKITNHRTDVGSRYSSTTIYQCPFTKEQKTLYGMGSTGGHSWRQAEDPVALLVDRLAPHPALTKATWLTFISIGVLSCAMGLALTIFVLVKEISHLRCSNWVQNFASTGCANNLPAKRL
jgi:hypothetical protein